MARFEPSTRGVGAERVGAAIDKSRRFGSATGAWGKARRGVASLTLEVGGIYATS
ncbi:hypothetical protein [uncultured Duncaniella sp.]|uniref:hypothetical protein n=1 Tax=uncultured Duncaniella sp. TaxID=2768039 RepID=UPI00321FFC8B